MHKAYKDIVDYQADIISTVYVNLALIGKKNQKYLEKKVEQDIAEVVKKVDLKGSSKELLDDTAYLYDEMGGYLALDQLNTLSTAVNEVEGKTARIVKNAPKDVRKQFTTMHNRVNKEITKGNTTIDQAVRIVKRTYRGQTIRYKDGTNYPVDSYLRMLYKTNQSRVCELRMNEVMKITGSKYFEYSSHSEPRASCLNVQGDVCAYDESGTIKDGRGNKVKVHNLTTEADYGKASGAQGVGCTHIMFVFIPGKSLQVNDKRNPIGEMSGDVKETKLTKDVTKKRKAQAKRPKKSSVQLTEDDINKLFDKNSQADKKRMLTWINDPDITDGFRYSILNATEKAVEPIVINWSTERANFAKFYTKNKALYGKTVLTTNKNDKHTFIHEFGHAYDYIMYGNKFNEERVVKTPKVDVKEYGWLAELVADKGESVEMKNKRAKMNEIRDNLPSQSNKDAYNKAALEYNALSNDITKMRKELGYEYTKYGSLSDVADAMSRGKMQAEHKTSGHGTAYYRKKENVTAEIYTHINTFMSYGDQEALDIAKQIMGEKTYNDYVKEVIKDNKYFAEIWG